MPSVDVHGDKRAPLTKSTSVCDSDRVEWRIALCWSIRAKENRKTGPKTHAWLIHLRGRWRISVQIGSLSHIRCSLRESIRILCLHDRLIDVFIHIREMAVWYLICVSLADSSECRADATTSISDVYECAFASTRTRLWHSHSHRFIHKFVFILVSFAKRNSASGSPTQLGSRRLFMFCACRVSAQWIRIRIACSKWAQAEVDTRRMRTKEITSIHYSRKKRFWKEKWTK